MDEFEGIIYKINIKDIKSFFVIKRIFSFLSENQILNIIRYNKELQKKFIVDIKDYKKESGKYKIGGKNGYGKEYIIKTNRIIFEGEYLKGKRNGKGKVYDYDDILIFEGEYLNGKKNGKGKRYYDNGKLMFEGEYFDGKNWNGKAYNKNGDIEFEIKNGNGNWKGYYYNGKLKFEGEYLNGERNGKGKEYDYKGKLVFEGEYLNGERNGKGKEYFHNGKLKYEGEYIEGNKWNGKGCNYNGITEFEIKNGNGKVLRKPL